MSCLYCHNPETQRTCSNCTRCLDVCPAKALLLKDGKIIHLSERCCNCDACLTACPHHSTPKSFTLGVTELLARIKRASPFLSGITVSGGECSLQSKSLIELFSLLHQETDLTAFVDSNGLLDDAEFDALNAATDAFCLDLKAFDEKLHHSLTGCSNLQVKRNIAAAAKAAKLYEVRTVLVEGYTDSTQEISELGNWLSALPGDFNWKLIPFRPQGVRGELSRKASFSTERYRTLGETARKILGERVITTN